MNEPAGPVVWAERSDAASVADHLAAVIGRPAQTVLAVPGGRTPLPIFEALAARDLPWNGTSFGLTDDRMVSADHPASNLGLLRRAFGGTGAKIRALEVGSKPLRYDLVWVGMGEDGHVASIFPNAVDGLPQAPAAVRTIPDPLPPEAPFERVTLTLGAMANCVEMILVIKGPRKRDLVMDALDGRSNLPIGRLLALLPSPLTIYWTP